MKRVDDIKVTLIIAIYKSAPFMPKLMESVFCQTHNNLEIILVDDGSPDNSGELCDGYAKQDDRVKVIHKQNGGVCDASNEGMKIMTGEYFSVIDGDDWIEQDFVEYLLKMASDHNADIALTDSCFTTRDTKINENDYTELWSPAQFARLILRPSMPIGPWNKLYKVDFFKRNNLSFEGLVSGETPYLCVRVANLDAKIIVGHKRLYHYRMNNVSSALTSKAIIYGENALINIKRTKIINHNKEITSDIEWHIYFNYRNLIKLIIENQLRLKYLSTYLKCRFMLIYMLPKIISQNKFTFSEKISYFKHAVFPEHYAKRIIALERACLEKDLLNVE